MAPSIGELEGPHELVWKTTEYKDPHAPTVFFGCYGLPDFFAIHQHKGKRWVFWAGSDITHLQNGYWLEDGGTLRLDPTDMAAWLNKNAENWCENEVERKALEDMGIDAKVGQSFMGDIHEYTVTYKQNDRPSVYMSVSGDNFSLYGWDIVEQIADKCDVDFHMYGSDNWTSVHPNVIVHGRVPKEQMNEEIKNMQSGLRLTVTMDGFSEITAKSILWGQYPIVAESFGYKHITSFRDLRNLVFQLNNLRYKAGPNPARLYYKEHLNKFPWAK